jgi:xanthine dehydrogenase accessory factor
MNLWKECQDLSEKGVPFVVVTQFNVKGSAPQDEGAKILVTQEGRFAGTIGGGKIEAAVIKKAQAILESSKPLPPELVTWNLQKDIGMSCGGAASYLFEHHHSASWPIVIFGAGHVAQTLVPILKTMNCQITCIDTREEWLSKFQDVKTLCPTEPKEVVKSFSPNTFFVCMSRGHDHDFPVLLEIFRLFPKAPYVGCIGSEIKAIKMRSQLKDAGASEEFLSKLRIPMGLPIGTNQLGEIAISIAGELIKVRDELNQTPE